MVALPAASVRTVSATPVYCSRLPTSRRCRSRRTAAGSRRPAALRTRADIAATAAFCVAFAGVAPVAVTTPFARWSAAVAVSSLMRTSRGGWLAHNTFDGVPWYRCWLELEPLLGGSARSAVMISYELSYGIVVSGRRAVVSPTRCPARHRQCAGERAERLRLFTIPQAHWFVFSTRGFGFIFSRAGV